MNGSISQPRFVGYASAMPSVNSLILSAAAKPWHFVCFLFWLAIPPNHIPAASRIIARIALNPILQFDPSDTLPAEQLQRWNHALYRATSGDKK